MNFVMQLWPVKKYSTVTMAGFTPFLVTITGKVESETGLASAPLGICLLCLSLQPAMIVRRKKNRSAAVFTSYAVTQEIVLGFL